MIQSHEELDVYHLAFKTAMQIFEISKKFPREETYALTDQMRRSSRAVCANLAEAWRKRRYPAHFKSKLSDSEGEAEETRLWLEFALLCRYIDKAPFQDLDDRYDKILGQRVNMITNADQWTIR